MREQSSDAHPKFFSKQPEKNITCKLFPVKAPCELFV